MSRAGQRWRWATAIFVATPTLAGCASVPPGRAAIQTVTVRGNDSIDDSEIEERIATTASPKFLGLFRGVIYDYSVLDRYVLQRDLERVERFYRARGFYDAKARAGQIVYTESNRVKVTVVVEEGQPVLLDEVKFSGGEALPEPVVRAVQAAVAETMKVRERFDEDGYEKAEGAAKRALTDSGYAYAEVKRSSDVDLSRHSARVLYTMTPGPRATLGPIRIEGLGKLPEPIVRRTLDLTEGEQYSTAELDSAVQALLDLGVFASVRVEPLLEPEPHPPFVVPVIVRVEPSRLRVIRLGGGFELDAIKTDVHLQSGWEDRNFLGGLRRFRVDFKPGVVFYPTRIPDFDAPTDYLLEERFRVELRQPSFIEARTSGFVRGDFDVYPVLLSPNVKRGDPILGYYEPRGSVGVDRTFRKLYGALSYNIQASFPFTYEGVKDESLRSVVLSYFELFNSLDFRDDKVRPHKGLYLSNDFQIAPGLVGDTRDIRVQPEVRAYVPIVPKVTFAARASVGMLFPLNFGDTLETNTAAGELPPGIDRSQWARDVQLAYFRAFFSGGSSSNRGWPLRGIGPHGVAPFYSPGIAAAQFAALCDPQNPDYDVARCLVPLGGLSLWEASAEVRFPISGELSGATFCDASDVSPRRVEFRLSRPHLSCGLGARYGTPVGPIRLDIAYRIPGMQILGPIERGDDGDPGDIFGLPIAIAFGIGEAF